MSLNQAIENRDMGAVNDILEDYQYVTLDAVQKDRLGKLKNHVLVGDILKMKVPNRTVGVKLGL